MALKKDTQEALLALKLAEVPPEWVNTLWEGDFCNEETITLPYHAVEESVLLNEENWQELVEACRKWPQASESKLPISPNPFFNPSSNIRWRLLDHPNGSRSLIQVSSVSPILPHGKN